MTTLNERGKDALIRRRKQAGGASVTYTRKAGGTLALTVIPGLSTATSADLPGRVEISERDYLIEVGDLAGTPPAIGDRIAETINGVAMTFELMTPKNGEPAWRYDTELRGMYRLHMKRVDVT